MNVEFKNEIEMEVNLRSSKEIPWNKANITAFSNNSAN